MTNCLQRAHRLDHLAPERDSSHMMSTWNGAAASGAIRRMNPGVLELRARDPIVDIDARLVDGPALARRVALACYDLSRDGLLSSATFCSVDLRA